MMVAKIRPVRVTRVARHLRVVFLKLAPSRDFETSSRAVKNHLQRPKETRVRTRLESP